MLLVRKLAWLTACSLLLCAPVVARAEDLPYEVRWERLSQDLELGRIASTSASFFGTALLAFRASLTHFRIAVLNAEDFGMKNADARSICRATKATLRINANFFDEAAKALGLVISRGMIRHPLHAGGRTLSGIFEVGRDTVRIIHRADFVPGAALEAVQAGPRLISGGSSVQSSNNSSSRRAGVCLDKTGQLVFYITAANSLRGISIGDLQKVLRHPQIDCREALGFDGGSSAQLFFSNSLPGATSQPDEIFIEGGVRVPVLLGLFIK